MKRLDNSTAQNADAIPLVRLNLILPFVEELDRRKINTNAVLITNGLAREALHDQNVFIPVIVVHRFLESVAQSADDPYIGFNIGLNMDLAGWPPFVDAVNQARTLQGYLARFIRSAAQEATSARHVLELDAEFALFKEIRTREPEINPVQNDAFTAGYAINLIRRGAGENWDARSIRVTVCEPKAIPHESMGFHVVGGDKSGVTMRFPTEWLLGTIDPDLALRAPGADPQAKSQAPRNLADSLRTVLQAHIDKVEMNVDYVADLLGLSRQSLQRRLKAHGTTLSKELNKLKQQRAITELTKSSRSIGEISSSLGFVSAASFTRAFKSWTGQSQSEYIKLHKPD
jgi:AraC-like DNA-binding protein